MSRVTESSGDGVDGEEQDDASSSLEDSSVQDTLTSFRQEWQKELESYPRRPQEVLEEDIAEDAETSNGGTLLDTESEARALFLKGVENEQSGKLYEAIQFYRRAVQLVPDIEFRLYESNKKGRERQAAIPDSGSSVTEKSETSYESDEETNELDMLSHQERIISKTRSVCAPHIEQQATHISALPLEIIMYIMRWVVSSDLDLRSLEMCSRVCRGFYLCSRDPEIWRLVCIKIWGVNCGDVANYHSWRQMFIERPRLHFNGCYISKTTYVRHGENNFQDQFYRPWHMVEYYRYLRFFPEGLVMMLTTPDDPPSCVGYLKHRISRNPSVLYGHFRLQDRRVVLFLKRQDSYTKSLMNNRFRQRRRETNQDLGEQTFQVELLITSSRKHNHIQLAWQHYSVITRYRSGEESVTNFDLPPNCFPSFWFSRVKSYTGESEYPLQ